MSDSAVTRAEQQLFGGALCSAEELPVRWQPQPLSAIASEQAAEHAEAMLRTLSLVEENFSDDGEEHGGKDIPMHRVEAKLQLLLEMVGALVARQCDLPAGQPLRWSRLGLNITTDSPASIGETGLVQLQLLPWLPQLLTLPCQVLASSAEDGQQKLWLAITPLSQSLESALERHLFRRHRRAISVTRRQPR